MGEVFLADDTQLERKVVIKFLPDELQHDPVARGRPQLSAHTRGRRSDTSVGSPHSKETVIPDPLSPFLSQTRTKL